MNAIGFLLQTRAARRGGDHFARNVALLAGLACLVAVVLSLFSKDPQTSVAVAYGLGLFLLMMVTAALVMLLPLRQIHGDADLHASLHSGRCYQEILGSQLTPRAILDEVAWHSTRTYLRSSAPWTVLLTLLWLLLLPGSAVLVMKVGACWLPLSALFVGSTSYLAQQFSICNAQLKVGFVNSTVGTLVLLAIGLPAGLTGTAAFIFFVAGYFKVALCLYALYLVLNPGICRSLASVTVNSLPHLCQRLQQYSRFLVGRRNRFLWIWSDNPIVVRERNREAGRIPAQWLGAILFQLPALVPVLLLVAQPLDQADYAAWFWTTMIALGAIQTIRAGYRCSHAIVAEVEQQTLESMQNTRLHAREFVWGWLQFGAFPLMVESLIVLVIVAAALDSFGVMGYALVLCLGPLVGAALGLAASCNRNRQLATRRFSEYLSAAAFGLAVFSWLCADFMACWPLLLLLYQAAAVAWAVRSLLCKIEIAK